MNAGLLSLTKALAEAGIRDGVQVNTVNPGAVRTDRLKVRLESMTKEHGIDLAAAERRFVEGSGVTRIGEPEDIAALAAFVVGPEGRFLHGSLIDMDGGSTKTRGSLRMARGWESKSVEDQISAKESAAGDPARLKPSSEEIRTRSKTRGSANGPNADACVPAERMRFAVSRASGESAC